MIKSSSIEDRTTESPPLNASHYGGQLNDSYSTVAAQHRNVARLEQDSHYQPSLSSTATITTPVTKWWVCRRPAFSAGPPSMLGIVPCYKVERLPCTYKLPPLCLRNRSPAMSTSMKDVFSVCCKHKFLHPSPWRCGNGTIACNRAAGEK